MIIRLVRTVTGKEGTFGVLHDGAYPLCVTCEDPWNDNKEGESCIPAGTYNVTPHNGTKYKGVWILNDVPGRSAILIHHGNTIRDTRGCILTGQRFGVWRSLPAVMNSIDTIAYLRKRLPPKFTLEIINCF